LIDEQIVILDAAAKPNTEVIQLCLGVSGGFLGGVRLILDIAKTALLEFQLEKFKKIISLYSSTAFLGRE